MSECLYFIFGPPAFEIELKNRWLMVNHRAVSAAVYNNGENYSFSLGNYSQHFHHSRQDDGSFGEILARFLFFLNLSKISTRSRQSWGDIRVFKNLSKLSARSYWDFTEIQTSRRDLGNLGKM